MGFCSLLKSHHSSYVIFDCANEYLHGAAPFLETKGYEIDVFDVDDCKKSIGFNWLETCESKAEIQQCMHVIFENGNKGNPSDYWIQSAENFATLIAYALWKYAPAEFKNMPNVLNMLQVFSYDMQAIDNWMLSHRDDSLSNEYKSISSAPEKTLLSTIATALNILSVYGLPNIAAITAKNTISFDEYRTRKKALFICGSPTSMKITKSVSSFYSSWFDHILKKLPLPDAMPITFLVDEAATMKLDLSQILELGRKYRISIITMWQDIGQINNIYNQNVTSNILANSRLKIFLPSSKSLSTCTMLEGLLGKYTYDDNGVAKTRPLKTAEEIFRLQDVLVLNGTNKPLLLPPKPFFEDKKLLGYTKLPAHIPKGHALPDIVPLLKF